MGVPTIVLMREGAEMHSEQEGEVRASRGADRMLGTGEGMEWYVLRARSGKERKIAEQLMTEVARLDYQELIRDALVPVEKIYQLRNGKKVSKERVVYSGYIFVEAHLDERSIDFLLNFPDVYGFLSLQRNGDPSPLREQEVNRMLGRVDELAGELELPAVPFQVGDVVRVIDGPFNTFTGVVAEVNEERKKLTVMVKIFERKTPLELSYMQVEKE